MRQQRRFGAPRWQEPRAFYVRWKFGISKVEPLASQRRQKLTEKLLFSSSAEKRSSDSRRPDEASWAAARVRGRRAAELFIGLVALHQHCPAPPAPLASSASPRTSQVGSVANVLPRCFPREQHCCLKCCLRDVAGCLSTAAQMTPSCSPLNRPQHQRDQFRGAAEPRDPGAGEASEHAVPQEQHR